MDASVPLNVPVSRSCLLEIDRSMLRAVADLHGPPTMPERCLTVLRMIALSLLLVGGALAYWILPAGSAGVLALLMAGAAYALLLIATHEMVHGTLLGWPWLEWRLGCLLGWPMAWPFATYARLHRLHHRWNGVDARDPERTQELPQDALATSLAGRFLTRHPFAVRCLLLGGVGLILDTAFKGWRLRSADPGLDGARVQDGLGVILLHSLFLTLAIAQDVLLRYALFWIILERVIGAMVQYRGLVEHHGLWPTAQGSAASAALPQRLRQRITSRDVVSAPWLNALMGGLPHHSTHHAFPALPSARLPEATARLAVLLQGEVWLRPARLENYVSALGTGLRPSRHR